MMCCLDMPPFMYPYDLCLDFSKEEKFYLFSARNNIIFIPNKNFFLITSGQQTQFARLFFGFIQQVFSSYLKKKHLNLFYGTIKEGFNVLIEITNYAWMLLERD